ncbi:MetQ/NlpA family ABC transporter substrate-binding protein [Anaerococcus sp. AGMB00486]|uniref:Lipoprotein n=2 Tax=Anaerococcus TaxID=165779 RepID=A0ABX2NBJ9_9FIRM|nr:MULTISPECIES: MetQ/NlpA family ABC transporter substrate-binding protein [Anaerococcus]MDY3006632.1 MetQ/NlpA family ABC transporter substrate-binding protein [Anaerococcus porci]MSS78101.1 MetQ/NlpA family ABC transporter substrate-binding protein [Anaerococcus porci]NVF12095.1 MetQ/NlpA family ABC transporter substrate-binding protein [Anaerococcus faecalis]
MKKLTKLALTFGLILSVTACSNNSSNKNVESNNSSNQSQAEDRFANADTIKLGVVGEKNEVWQDIAKRYEKDTGKRIEIISFSDYNQPNEALNSGDIDINAFQHKKFLEDYNQSHKTDIVSIGDTLLAPMGIYSDKIKDVKEIEIGDKIAIPNDPTNGARALFLLQSAGLIELNGKEGDAITVANIKNNPKNLEIIELDASQTARNLTEVKASVINSGMAVDAGFIPTEDAIYLEDKNDPAKAIYVNIIAAKKEDKDSKTLENIVKNYYQTDETKKIVEKESKGSEIPAW